MTVGLEDKMLSVSTAKMPELTASQAVELLKLVRAIAVGHGYVVHPLLGRSKKSYSKFAMVEDCRRYLLSIKLDWGTHRG